MNHRRRVIRTELAIREREEAGHRRMPFTYGMFRPRDPLVRSARVLVNEATDKEVADLHAWFLYAYRHRPVEAFTAPRAAPPVVHRLIAALTPPIGEKR